MFNKIGFGRVLFNRLLSIITPPPVKQGACESYYITRDVLVGIIDRHPSLYIDEDRTDIVYDDKSEINMYSIDERVEIYIIAERVSLKQEVII